MKRFFALCMLFGLLSAGGPVQASPVVVTPGEASSYLYFPAGVTAQGEAGTTSGLVGMIAAFYQPPAPEWLICDGRTIQAADYPDLVKHLSPGNPSASSAVLPDFRGYFLRGWDSMGGSSAGVDAGRAARTVQADENKGHSHAGATSVDGSHNHTWTMVYSFSGSGPVTLESGSVVGSYTETTSTNGAHSHTFTTSSSGGVESRPKNIAVIYAIRAK